MHLLYYFYLLIIIESDIFTLCYPTVHGRYTKDIRDYELTIPRRLNSDGEFQSYDIPHFFDHDFANRRRKRSVGDPHSIHYGVTFGGAKHHLELWPNHGFVSSNLLSEIRDPTTKVQNRIMRGLRNKKLCHYTGRVRGISGSKVALSTCDGLAGYVIIDGKTYFIEPLAEHVPNDQGHHAHVVHEPESANYNPLSRACGTSTNWEEAWKQRYMRMYMEGNEPHNVSTRGYDSVHRYLEILLVCDKKFITFHKNSDIENYVLTIMNMVSDFYHDGTAGHLMDVVLVRIMYLEKEEEEIDLNINHSAADTLISFCKWQVTINPKEVTNPHHHDIAVLFSREDLCGEDQATECGLTGLANVASACVPDESCAINEDNGLILGVVTAHEIGHVMGCSHDREEESGCTSQDEDKNYYVMSPYVHTNTVKWSTCSRKYITTLLEDNLGECLNDEPEVSRYEYPSMMPGVVYDANAQCLFSFPKSKACPQDEEIYCNTLFCDPGTGCTSNSDDPPADGTKCAANKWCIRSKCVEIGERPQAVNGGWGEWSKPTQCSRTCGGGVSYQERDCNNPVPLNKGRYCIGERKKVQICNANPCPEGVPSFRAVQCTEMDKKENKGRLFTWKPFFVPDDPCTLYCINNEMVYSKLAPSVKDGTKCKEGTKDMCVFGKCRKVGCDSVLESDAVEDECGVCKGDGTQCKKVDETYTGAPGHDYEKIVTIPNGCRNIAVHELRQSVNTIAISSADGKKFYLNGDHLEAQNGDYSIAGVDAIYNHDEDNKESLIIHGPIKESLLLYVVFYIQENVGYHYKYTEPTPQPTYQPHYHWEFIEFGDCSARCGGGVETAEPECVEEKAGKVTPTFCDAKEKPHPTTRKCNEQECTTKWRVGRWGKCTACKFQSGIRVREVECVKEAAEPGNDDVLVEDDQCVAPKPGTRELCNSHKKCGKEKRHVDNIPAEVKQHLWLQTLEDQLHQNYYDQRRPVEKSVAEMDKRCEPIGKPNEKQNETHHQKQNITLKVGTTVTDKQPPEQVKLVVVPKKQSHLSLNLTDQAFETMGSDIGDSLDTAHQKIYTGKEAIKLLKQLQHPSNKSKSTNS